jgi:hypothetical protein
LSVFRFDGEGFSHGSSWSRDPSKAKPHHGSVGQDTWTLDHMASDAIEDWSWLGQ